MTVAPFEVLPTDSGYTWRIIGASGRTLVYPDQAYPTDFAAAAAAKNARAGFEAAAQRVDGARV